MTEINRVVVLGAGVMGSGIAAHMANAGVDVWLLDIPPKDTSKPRNALADSAKETMLKRGQAFVHPSRAAKLHTGNMEDDLDIVAQADWVVEAVIETLEIKQALYRRVCAHLPPHAVLSSNTSTLPLHALQEGLPAACARDLCITHFFNPPRIQRLFECVTPEGMNADKRAALARFADIRLGKEVVHAKDTPGFIGNRIGIFWMLAGLHKAVEHGLTVEEADALMGKPFGFPKTGIFGLYDLVGIDLIPYIADSMLRYLPESDPYHRYGAHPPLLGTMIAEGFTGRKGKGGFTKVEKDADGKKRFCTLELHANSSLTYRAAQTPDSATLAYAKQGMRALLEAPGKGGAFVRDVLVETFGYAASLLPEIAHSIADIDSAMENGFNWSMGPFRLIDAWGQEGETGAAWLTSQLRARGMTVPPLLEHATAQGFYHLEHGARRYLDVGGAYQEQQEPEGAWKLATRTTGATPVLRGTGVTVWDIGDGIACAELTNKMGTLLPATFETLGRAIERLRRDFLGLVIGHDGAHFSAGFNLNFVIEAARKGDWQTISDAIQQGQHTMKALKYAPLAVIGAPSGLALGGGCETLLHCDSVQAHMESRIGLVEVNIGVIPAWGGTTEHLLRHMREAKDIGSQVQAAGDVFDIIATAKTSTSAMEACDMGILRDAYCGYTMNRARLLEDAKQHALARANDYVPPARTPVTLARGAILAALTEQIDRLHDAGSVSRDKEHVLRALAYVISGGSQSNAEAAREQLHASMDGSHQEQLTEVTEDQFLALEHEAFMELVQHPHAIRQMEKAIG